MYLELADQASIVASTLVIVQILKYSLRTIPVLKDVPTWIYSVAVAAVCTLLSVHVLGAMEVPQGQTVWSLVWSTVIAAGAASGFHSWLANKSDSPADKPPMSAQLSKLFPLLILSAFVVSCGPRPLSDADVVKMASDSLASVNRSLVRLSQAEKISVESLEACLELSEMARLEIEAMRDRLRQNLPVSTENFDEIVAEIGRVSGVTVVPITALKEKPDVATRTDPVPVP